jgi:DnaJ family protein C protein 7
MEIEADPSPELGGSSSSPIVLDDAPTGAADAAAAAAEALAAEAERFKEDGNEHFRAGRNDEALVAYGRAIAAGPGVAVYYGNRAAVYLHQGNLPAALADCEKALALDPKFWKAQLRAGDAHAKLGNFAQARRAFRSVLDLEPKQPVALRELRSIEEAERLVDRGRELLDAGHPDDARQVLLKALDVAPASVRVRCMIAECFLRERRFDEAGKVAQSVLKDDSSNAEAMYLVAMSKAYAGDTGKAKEILRSILTLQPDFGKAATAFRRLNRIETLKEEGNVAFKRHNYRDAVRVYTEALALDPDNANLNMQLYSNRAAAYLQLGDHSQVVADCNAALAIDPGYVKALMRRAAAYLKLERFQEAVFDYEKLKTMEPQSHDIASGLRQAKLGLKRASRKDYYKILEIERSADDDAIRKAYRRGAMKWHPDRHENDPPEEKKRAEDMFKDVGEAYSVLSDATKRRQYDQGADLQDIEQGGGFGGGGFEGADINPFDVFNMMFGGGGGFPSGAGGPRGGGRRGGGFGGGGGFQSFHFG